MRSPPASVFLPPLLMKMTAFRLSFYILIDLLLPTEACKWGKREAATGRLNFLTAVEQEEELAFAACNTDQVDGLTWQEVQRCEVKEKYYLLMSKVGIEAPIKDAFEMADLNSDGTLLFKEWKDWVTQQIRRNMFM